MTGVPCQGHRQELFEVSRNPGSAALSAAGREFEFSVEAPVVLASPTVELDASKLVSLSTSDEGSKHFLCACGIARGDGPVRLSLRMTKGTRSGAAARDGGPILGAIAKSLWKRVTRKK